MLGRSIAVGNVCAAYKERISFSWLGGGGGGGGGGR